METPNAVERPIHHTPHVYALDNLLPVVWQLIATHLGGYDVMALQMTCSRGVVGRWRNIKIRDFEIMPSSALHWSGAAIGTLQHLKGLQSIKIHDPNLSAWKQGPKMLIYFPPQLLRLALRLPMKVEDWLLILPSQDPKTEEKEMTLAESRSQALQTVDEQYVAVDLSALFPDLQYLDIQGGISFGARALGQVRISAEKESKMAIEKRNHERTSVAALVHLYCHLPNKQLKTLIMPTLRLNKEDVENAAHSKMLNPSYTATAPSTGAKSKNSKNKNAKNKNKASSSASSSASGTQGSCIFDALSYLPASLETLEFSIGEAHRAWYEELELPTNILGRLPVNLTSLSCVLQRIQYKLTAAKQTLLFAPLGRITSLTNLSVLLGDQNLLLGPQIFSSFNEPLIPVDAPSDELSVPSSIQLTTLQLNLTERSLVAHDFISSLPRSLTCLEFCLKDSPFPRGPQVQTSFGSQLPPSLTSLIVCLTASTGAPVVPMGGGIQDLPSGLTLLDWGDRCMVSDEQISKLPKTLETLRLDLSPSAFPQGIDYGYYDFEDIYQDDVQSRKPHLDELALEHTLTDTAALLLPSQLKKIILYHTSFGRGFFTGMPGSVTHLEIVTDKELDGDLFSMSSLQFLYIDAPYLCLESLSSLPDSMRTLRLIEPATAPSFDHAHLATTRRPIEDYTFSDAAIARLPPSLTDLHVTGARNVSNEARWPPSLTSLALTASCFLTEQVLPRFPKTLHHLQIQRIVIAPHACPSRTEIINTMPPFLLAHLLPWMTTKNRNVDFSSLA